MDELEAQLGTTRDVRAILNSARSLAKDGKNLELVMAEFRSAAEDGIKVPKDEKDEILQIAYTSGIDYMVTLGRSLQNNRQDASALKVYTRAKVLASVAQIEMPLDVLHAMHALVLKQNIRTAQAELDVGVQAYASR